MQITATAIKTSLLLAINGICPVSWF